MTDIHVEKVGAGILATFDDSSTVWFETADVAFSFASAVMAVALMSSENGVLDEMDEQGVFGHEGPR